MSPTYDVYPNAPLILTAFEVRHPAAEPLGQTQRRVLKTLLPSLPIMRSAQQVEVQATLDGAAATSQAEEFPRFLNRESTMAVAFRATSIVVECSEYPGWAAYSALIREALDARMKAAPIDGYERIGLRYIDEIRTPDPIQWSKWIQPSLLGPEGLAGAVGLSFQGFQGMAVYGETPGHAFALRYGPRAGYAVDPSWDLRRKPSAPGEFFLVDIDSFWTPPEGVPECLPDSVMEKAQELHTPIRGLFESVITGEYRDSILNTSD